MPRKFLMPLLAAAFLVTPPMLPSSFVSAMVPGLSRGAQAASTVNYGKSNHYRTTTTFHTHHSNSYRMGGGGGGRTK